MKKLIWLGCLSYFVIGLATVIFGTLMSNLLHDYGRNFSDGGSIVFAQFGGFLAGVLFAPRCVRSLGYRRGIWLAFAGLFAAHAILFLQPYWYVLFIPATLNGFCFGLAQTAIGTLLLEASDKNKAVTMSRLEVAFGVGALLMPAISSLFLKNNSGFGPFAIVASCACLMMMIWIFSYTDYAKKAGNEGAEPDTSAAKHSTTNIIKFYPLAFLMCFVFLYVGLETSTINFLPSVFESRLHFESSQATLTVSIFWISMIIGRIFSGVIAEQIGYFKFLLISSSGALISLIGLAFFENAWIVFALVFAAGLFLSGIFAIAVVHANNANPESTKQTTSIIIASGGIGGALLPLLVGWSMDAVQPGAATWLLAGFAVLMILFLLQVRTVPSAKVRRHKIVENDINISGRQ
ncbi:MFS transporter [Paenibacillus aestuarii]|uniref:MFS transporter n=1 Tax=Paenibacillus aestuarii TaxID=516965 RepID=A0ABW0K5W3_9BACL|nr:MFS transporter [Paenibacillus aestuarii]